MKTLNTRFVLLFSVAVWAMVLQALATRHVPVVVLSQPVPPERIHWTPAVPASAVLATVHVIREARFKGWAMPTTLTIDGKEVAVIKNGENLMVRIPPGQYSVGLRYEGQGPLIPQPAAHEREKASVESVLELAGGKYHDLRIVPDESWNWQLSRAGD